MHPWYEYMFGSNSYCDHLSQTGESIFGVPRFYGEISEIPVGYVYIRLFGYKVRICLRVEMLKLHENFHVNSNKTLRTALIFKSIYENNASICSRPGYFFVCIFCFSSLDNNPTYGKKLMLKDKCDPSISKHVRCVYNYNIYTSLKLQLIFRDIN